MFGIPLLRSAFHSAWRSTESKAALMSRNATRSGRSNSRWISASRRKANVDQPATNPDCCGLRVASNSGWILARSMWAKTLPGMESNVCIMYIVTLKSRLFGSLLHEGIVRKLGEVGVRFPTRISNCGPVLYHFQYKAKYWSKNEIFHTPAFDAPMSSVPSGILS